LLSPKSSPKHSPTKSPRKFFRSGTAPPKEVSFCNVEKLEEIGSGSAGTKVYKAYADGWLCCLKELTLDDFTTEKDITNFKKEILTYASLPTDNIHLCRFLGWQMSNSHVQLFLTLYDYTLKDLINDRKSVGAFFSEYEIIDYSIQLLGALHVVHNRRIMHRDLKSFNILVRKGATSNSNPNVSVASNVLVLSDFGDSIVCTQKTTNTFTGTLCWVAPEVLLSTKTNKGYSSQADLWSFGMVMYELMTLEIPYHEEPTTIGISKKIVLGKLPTISEKVAELYRNILPVWESLVAYDPDQRPTAAGALMLFAKLRSDLQPK